MRDPKARRNSNRDGRKGAGLLAAAGAAAVGLATGLAVGASRRALGQVGQAMTGDWEDALKVDHLLIGELFDLLEAAPPRQRARRRELFRRLRLAMERHAFLEETVIYPALRLNEPPNDHGAELHDHAELKTQLFAIESAGPEDPRWASQVKLLRQTAERHVRDEEAQTFVRLRDALDGEQAAEVTRMLRRAADRMR